MSTSRPLIVLALVLLGFGLAAPAEAQVRNKCRAAKKACVAKKLQQLLACSAAADKKGELVDLACIAKAKARFDGGVKPEKGCFAKVEAKQNPAKPETVCPTTNDTATIEAAVDEFVDAIGCQLTQGECFPASGSGEACDSAQVVGAGGFGDQATGEFVFDYDACGLPGAFDGPDRVYAIVVPPGLTITVRVTPVSGSGGASLALFAGLANCGATDANLCADVDTPSLSEQVVVQATNNETGNVVYYALVGAPGVDPVEYDMSIVIGN